MYGEICISCCHLANIERLWENECVNLSSLRGLNVNAYINYEINYIMRIMMKFSKKIKLSVNLNYDIKQANFNNSAWFSK